MVFDYRRWLITQLNDRWTLAAELRKNALESCLLERRYSLCGVPATCGDVAIKNTPNKERQAKPRIRGAIQEYQTSLIEQVKDRIPIENHHHHCHLPSLKHISMESDPAKARKEHPYLNVSVLVSHL
eukprot:4201634-Amphidinium_carterae.1